MEMDLSFIFSFFHNLRLPEHSLFERIIITLYLTVPVIILTICLRVILDLLEDYYLVPGKSETRNLQKVLNLKCCNFSKYECLVAKNFITPSSRLNASWTDVVGLEDVIDNLKRNAIYPMMAVDSLSRNSNAISCPKGILFHGPGCGQILLAKAMAKEINYCFINIDFGSMVDKYTRFEYFGAKTYEKIAKAIFTMVEKVQPSILFIEKIDLMCAIISKEDCERSTIIKNMFVKFWDQWITDSSKTIIVIGSTKRPEAVDEVILRKMTTRIYIPLPNIIQRKHILTSLLKNEKLDDDFDLQKLGEITEGFSCSDLGDIVRATGINCLEDGSNITPKILDLAIQASEESIPKDLLTHQLDKVDSKYWLNRRIPIMEELNRKKREKSLTYVCIRPFSMRDFVLAIEKTLEAKIEMIQNTKSTFLYNGECLSSSSPN